MKPLVVLLNVFVPGVGTLVMGKYLVAFFQWAIWAFGIVLSFTMIGAIVGIPLSTIAWIWAIVTAANYQDPAQQMPPQTFKSRIGAQ